MSEASSSSRSGWEDPSVPAGRIEKLSDGWALAFDKQFDYPAAHIWDVLTNPRKVEQWMGSVTPDWELGKEYTVEMGGGSVSGTVLQLTPRSSLQITWDDELGEESVLEWQVLESDGGALLQFRSRTDTADFLAEGSAGWQGILLAFAAVAAGTPPPGMEQPAQWRALRDAYSKEFDVSPTMGFLEETPGDTTLVFERWYDAPAEDITAAVESSGGNLRLGEGADFSVEETDGVGKLRIRQRIDGGNPQDTAALMAAWHLALDSAAVRLLGETPHPNSHRLRALEALYSASA
ncbi:SRPBCC domain-containing protein [Arthrobacter sp. Sa2CUA1]|uniref:SRPBCC domain-containing protein n=1 Tax=Arthrobacter gallicola TaxID=2762225 RepID=A0ABR8UU01_9MICC|nr:SRPBCC domain-containing protein [Arthrobacter gallicola]MBD7995852.1 SRPBCC domain-containing protein [Arthrobacter gallicola]